MARFIIKTISFIIFSMCLGLFTSCGSMDQDSMRSNFYVESVENENNKSKIGPDSVSVDSTIMDKNKLNGTLDSLDVSQTAKPDSIDVTMLKKNKVKTFKYYRIRHKFYIAENNESKDDKEVLKGEVSFLPEELTFDYDSSVYQN